MTNLAHRLDCHIISVTATEALIVAIERTSHDISLFIWVPCLDRVIATASIAVLRICVRLIRCIIVLNRMLAHVE